MKNNIIKIVCLILVVILVICMVVFGKNIFNKKEDKGPNKMDAVYDVKYSILKDSYCSCITFRSNGKFSEYDCDSEPTEMPFNGEYYNKYNYASDKITFTGKSVKNVTAEVLYWDQDKLTLKVLGSNQNKKCSSNGKDTYEYYAYEVSANGKKIKEILNRINNDSLIIQYWGDDGEFSCNKIESERCSDAKLITIDKIMSELEEGGDFTLTYYRDEKGNIESVYINKM